MFLQVDIFPWWRRGFVWFRWTLRTRRTQYRICQHTLLGSQRFPGLWAGMLEEDFACARMCNGLSGRHSGCGVGWGSAAGVADLLGLPRSQVPPARAHKILEGVQARLANRADVPAKFKNAVAVLMFVQHNFCDIRKVVKRRCGHRRRIIPKEVLAAAEAGAEEEEDADDEEEALWAAGEGLRAAPRSPLKQKAALPRTPAAQYGISRLRQRLPIFEGYPDAGGKKVEGIKANQLVGLFLPARASDLLLEIFPKSLADAGTVLVPINFLYTKGAAPGRPSGQAPVSRIRTRLVTSPVGAARVMEYVLKKKGGSQSLSRMSKERSDVWAGKKPQYSGVGPGATHECENEPSRPPR